MVDKCAIMQARSSARRPGPIVSMSKTPVIEPFETNSWPSWKSPWVGSRPGSRPARPLETCPTSHLSCGSSTGSAAAIISAYVATAPVQGGRRGSATTADGSESSNMIKLSAAQGMASSKIAWVSGRPGTSGSTRMKSAVAAATTAAGNRARRSSSCRCSVGAYTDSRNTLTKKVRGPLLVVITALSTARLRGR